MSSNNILTINQIIQSDRYVLNKLAPFAGRSLEIETSSPNFSIVVFFGFDRLSLSGISAELLNITPDAKVSGETKTLVNLLTKNTPQPLTNSKIAVAGDAQFMQDIFQHILILVVVNSLSHLLITADFFGVFHFYAS